MTASPLVRGNPSRVLDMVRTQLAPDQRERPWATPGEMAAALDRTTIQTPALDLIDARLVDVADGRAERQIISMPPQEGKSLRTSVWFPLWLLHRNPNLRIVIVSYQHEIARRWGRRIRDLLKANPQLGLTLSQSSQRQDEFELLGYSGGVVCVGVEGGLTSRAVDVMIIDDPYKDAKQADSKAWAKTVRNFWENVALTRLGPGAPVVLIQTRWREDDLAGWLAKEGEDWKVLNIPAQADHDPEKGEVDVLGREPGEFMESARRRTPADWFKKMREVGSRVWNALYQGRPSPAEGTIFKRENWRYYDQPLWIQREDGSRIITHFDDALQSWDMTFKDTESADFVVGQVWMRRGADSFLLDQVRGRMDFPATIRALKAMTARWPQVLLKLVEDKANGTAVIASLNRTIGGIVPVEPDGGKTARASAVSPLQESQNVWLPDPLLLAEGDEAPYAWVSDFVEEHAGFPTAAHDDQVDGTSQGLNRLVLQPLLAGDLFLTAEDVFEELEETGSYIPSI